MDLYRDLFSEEPEGTGKLPAVTDASTSASEIGTVDAAILAAPWRKTHIWLIGLGIFFVVGIVVIFSVIYFMPKKLPEPIIEPKITIPEPKPPPVDPEPPMGEGIGERDVTPVPKPVTKATGRLFLNAIPWAKVYRGKKFLGDTPIEDLRLPIGKHRLRLVNAEMKVNKPVWLVIRKNKITRRVFDLKKE